ncbi:rhodanese-like domain-containing protein [Shewanella sp. NKUCC05_KAH]|jgi:rhodanese-related sulfurtransferase|uniref:Rhodanese-like domain-containing protein n=1 Tax=Shewanella oncorhynchi TaxID=2726434 RepID=A0AA50Q570_9GAMM|nr:MULTISPECIES: rhodanese-like domain-containing protein [Shewanella]RBP82316.1 rhodanese-related sulfurtransferase [Shewanella putrefaciens]GCF91918.1 sulfurtransferase [Shewanella sp. M-Br]MBI1673285.1 rhodanese-like domain-containing protein [Shewanella sp. DW31]MBS0041235.1 rhodanese-like domain-containing protein [Shewanella sp. M16]MBW3516055.1 rhodanese-like domain-containing protein [Shewanella sp. NKUCC01_JLK]
MHNMLRQSVSRILMVLALGVTAMPVIAGGGSEMSEVPYNEIQLNPISMMEAETLVGKQGVYFFDVNTLEIWAEGFIPGAVFFNVQNWRELLPKNKDAVMVFYCANRLCTSSNMAARETMKLGYTGVRHMADGIYGWRMSGRVTEKP